MGRVTSVIEAYKLAYRSALKESLFQTCKLVCNYKDVTEHTHVPMIRALEAKSLRKLICVPRGTLKSSVGSVAFPIWLLMNNPDLRILIDSEVYGNSITYLREAKGILQSQEFIDVFGNWKSDIWNEGEILIKPRTRNLKEASITCGAIGTIKVGQHYDVIIGDDYSSPKNTASPEQRKKVIDHYQYNQSILEPGGIYALIGTRYHEEDIIGWVMKNELGLKDSNSKDSLKILRLEKGVYYYE